GVSLWTYERGKHNEVIQQEFDDTGEMLVGVIRTKQLPSPQPEYGARTAGVSQMGAPLIGLLTDRERHRTGFGGSFEGVVGLHHVLQFEPVGGELLGGELALRDEFGQ